MICKQHTLSRNTINIGCLTHHAMGIGSHIPVTNIITPNHDYIGFFLCMQIVC